MEAFEAHHIDVLVSTTVIEVGINVPNATVMLVENAERFGLAQLHQLRGRVGRGDKQSYCIFISKSERPETMERLKILNESNDGFYIAGKDLALRGRETFSGSDRAGICSLRWAISIVMRPFCRARASGLTECLPRMRRFPGKSTRRLRDR